LDGFSHENLNSVLKVWEGKWARFKVYGNASTKGGITIPLTI
jgi:hypothetical protein